MTAARRAEETRAQGFANSRVLRGGVRAWKEAGYPLVAGEAGGARWAALFPECVCTHEGVECVVLPVEGALDQVQAPAFLARIRRELKKRPPHIVADLGKVDRMDSAGLAILVQASREAKDQRVCLSISNPSPAATAALQFARLETFFPPQGTDH